MTTIPLDPNSPQGVEVARRLTTTLAKAHYAIQARRAAAQTAQKRTA
jgi:hypothetical protein